MVFISLVFPFIGFSSYSQEKESSTISLIIEEVNSSLVIYKNKNWSDKFTPKPSDFGFELKSFSIDTAQLYPIVRKVISSNKKI
jgi:hypothetical protein